MLLGVGGLLVFDDFKYVYNFSRAIAWFLLIKREQFLFHYFYLKHQILKASKRSLKMAWLQASNFK